MLNKAEIKKLIQDKKLIKHFIDLDVQLTPNGFDLTINKIFTYRNGGVLDFSNKEREISEEQEIAAQKRWPEDEFGWWELPCGMYKVRTNEVVSLPNDLTALAFPRSSLLRMGATTYHGVWDAGFSGKGEFILNVGNPAGLRIKENSRVAQLVFFQVNPTEEYKGVYKNLK